MSTPLVEAARARGAGVMARTRAALLSAAEDCVAEGGVRGTTMAQVAARAGVAKATLYNHFRAKDDVLRALLHDRAQALSERCATTAGQAGLAAALEQAVASLAGSAALRRVAADEPALLAPLLAGPPQAAALVEPVLRAAGAPAGPDDVELALRWLLSTLLWPTTGAGRVTAALHGAGAPATGAVVPQQARPAGLGWPG